MTKHLNYPACVVHTCSCDALCNGFELFNSLVLCVLLSLFSLSFLRFKCVFFLCLHQKQYSESWEEKKTTGITIFFPALAPSLSLRSCIYICAVCTFSGGAAAESLFTLDAINKIVFNSHNNFIQMPCHKDEWLSSTSHTAQTNSRVCFRSFCSVSFSFFFYTVHVAAFALACRSFGCSLLCVSVRILCNDERWSLGFISVFQFLCDLCSFFGLFLSISLARSRSFDSRALFPFPQ